MSAVQQESSIADVKRMILEHTEMRAYHVGLECRDEKCTIRGKTPAELFENIIVACEEESRGDRKIFIDCLRDLIDVFREVVEDVASRI